MKFSYLLIAFFFLILNGCSDFSSDSNEFELSGKFYACDGDRYGEIIDDSKLGKKQYCNGYRWIDLVPEDSIVTIRPESKDSTVGDLLESKDSSQIMYECNNGSIVINKNLCSKNPKEYLPLDDSEYPYAGIPRIVIETENFRAIKDRETEIPAKLQIWGENAPESEIMELTIRGRGNSSWLYMPKKSYKIKLKQKQNLLGMPKDKDWALISNYADKTLLKNKITYKLSNLIGMEYTPQNKFIEFFLNNEYMGIYLLTETIKISSHRVNVNSTSYLVEFNNHSKSGDQVITTNNGITFEIHSPQNASSIEKEILKKHLDSLENIITQSNIPDSVIEQLFDTDAYIKYYWLQEFSKNKDGAFLSSVYFTWAPRKKIKMGPAWDFDGAYGVNPYYNAKPPSGWLTRNYYWNKALFKNKAFLKKVNTFWIENQIYFENITDSTLYYSQCISKAINNNFKKWPILKQTSDILHQYPYSSYNDAIDTLEFWIKNRLDWIQDNLK